MYFEGITTIALIIISYPVHLVSPSSLLSTQYRKKTSWSIKCSFIQCHNFHCCSSWNGRLVHRSGLSKVLEDISHWSKVWFQPIEVHILLLVSWECFTFSQMEDKILVHSGRLVHIFTVTATAMWSYIKTNTTRSSLISCSDLHRKGWNIQHSRGWILSINSEEE